MTLRSLRLAVSEPTHSALKQATSAVKWLRPLVQGRTKTQDQVIYDLSAGESLDGLSAEEPREALLKIAERLGSEARAIHVRLIRLQSVSEAVAEELKKLGEQKAALSHSTHELLVEACNVYLQVFNMAHEELEMFLQGGTNRDGKFVYSNYSLEAFQETMRSLMQPLKELELKLLDVHRTLMRACQAIHMESLTQLEMIEYGLDHHGTVGEFAVHRAVEVAINRDTDGKLTITEKLGDTTISFKLAKADLSNSERFKEVVTGLRKLVGK